MNTIEKIKRVTRSIRVVLATVCLLSFSGASAAGGDTIVQRPVAVESSAQVFETIEGGYSPEKKTLAITPYYMQRLPLVAIKTNLLYNALTSFNLGVEFRLNKHLTLDFPVNWRPFNWGSSTKMFRHFMVQPEVRWWKEAFNGHFLGANLLYSQFNIGGHKLPLGLLPAVRDQRYQGDMYGGGFSYGYHWLLSSRFSFEFTVGLGYLYLDYDKYACRSCKKKLGSGHKHYFGPIKMGISLIYMIK